MNERIPSRSARRLLATIAATASLLAGAAPVRAADVTQEIDAEIWTVGDNYSSFFAGAERLVGSIVYDDAIADSSAAPDVGTFVGALVSLTVSIPSLGYGWSADAGNLFTFLDRFSAEDQFTASSLVNDPIGTPINGYPIRSVAVAFAGDDLLVSDAPPGPGARYDYGNVFLEFQDDFGTIVGRASIVFAPEPGGLLAAIAALAGLALAARNRLRMVSNSQGGD